MTQDHTQEINIQEHKTLGLPRRIRMYIVECKQTIELPCVRRLIVGRKNSTQPVDIDLSPVKAHELGISRQHLELIPAQDELLVRDLHTVNGSSINREPLQPGREYQIKDGDMLKLGRMHITVEFVYS